MDHPFPRTVKKVHFSSHLEALVFSCFPPKSIYLAMGHGDQEHAFHTSNPSKSRYAIDLGREEKTRKKKKKRLNLLKKSLIVITSNFLPQTRSVLGTL